jgi:hypothetical protein
VTRFVAPQSLVFWIRLELRYVLQKKRQLSLANRVLSDVTHYLPGQQSPRSPASPSRNTPPHLLVRLPDYREPSLHKNRAPEQSGASCL